MMPVLHLEDVPVEMYRSLEQIAAAQEQSIETAALALLRDALGQTGTTVPPQPTQQELLADLKRRSFTPPPGTPDSVELLREDRAR
jgi:hypothetical protein